MSHVEESTQRYLSTKLKYLEAIQGARLPCIWILSILTQFFRGFMYALMLAKKSFQAGCRKIIGVDGCFFKGACNSEQLCALGRDANNQIYPIAWAVVEKETEDSWSWFLGFLQKDLQITIGGRGWVIISDQQKVNDLVYIQIMVCP